MTSSTLLHLVMSPESICHAGGHINAFSIVTPEPYEQNFLFIAQHGIYMRHSKKGGSDGKLPNWMIRRPEVFATIERLPQSRALWMIPVSASANCDFLQIYSFPLLFLQMAADIYQKDPRVAQRRQNQPKDYDLGVIC